MLLCSLMNVNLRFAECLFVLKLSNITVYFVTFYCMCCQCHRVFYDVRRLESLFAMFVFTVLCKYMAIADTSQCHRVCYVGNLVQIKA